MQQLQNGHYAHHNLETIARAQKDSPSLKRAREIFAAVVIASSMVRSIPYQRAHLAFAIIQTLLLSIDIILVRGTTQYCIHARTYPLHFKVYTVIVPESNPALWAADSKASNRQS